MYTTSPSSRPLENLDVIGVVLAPGDYHALFQLGGPPRVLRPGARSGHLLPRCRPGRGPHRLQRGCTALPASSTTILAEMFIPGSRSCGGTPSTWMVTG